MTDTFVIPPHHLLSILLPEFSPSLFHIPPPPISFWSNFSHQRQYFIFLSNHLNLTSLDDWFSLKKIHLAHFNILSILSHYFDSSLEKALSTLFPSYHHPKFLRSHSTPRAFFYFLSHHFEFGEFVPQCWYELRARELKERGGISLLLAHDGSPSRALFKSFPEFYWDTSLFRERNGTEVDIVREKNGTCGKNEEKVMEKIVHCLGFILGNRMEKIELHRI